MRTLLILISLFLLSGCSQEKVEETPPPPALLAINADSPGSRVDVETVLAAGKLNIAYFSAEWCPDCKILEPKLIKLLETRQDIHLFKVDILDWESEVAQQFSIVRLPHMQLYDDEGKLISAGEKAEVQVKEMLESASPTPEEPS